jgi:hypothetical protein
MTTLMDCRIEANTAAYLGVGDGFHLSRGRRQRCALLAAFASLAGFPALTPAVLQELGPSS